MSLLITAWDLLISTRRLERSLLITCLGFID